MHESPGEERCLRADELERFALGEDSSAALRAHVEQCAGCAAALEAVRAENAFLHEVAQARRRADRMAPADAPTIAGFQLLAPLYSGGQGVVYRAYHEATRREVALKVPLHGVLASQRQRLRFEREVELIGGLRHPNVVTLYDAGVCADGRAYFAMEFVAGVTITEFAAAVLRQSPNRSTATRRILATFRQVCAAITCAHQRGIIHRDLKPSNILVDAAGEPRVLDFGVAKLIQSAAEGDMTRTAEFVGTLAYAAPEQVQSEPARIDTRTDVYALGAVLYEMLCGRPMLDAGESLATVVRRILDDAPPQPSKVCQAVDDELETILLTALAKDPERRYPSVEALQRDLGHYLNGEALDAKRASGWYRLRKFARRNRWPLGAAASLVATVLGFAVMMTYLYGQATAARTLAVREGRRAQEHADISSQTVSFVRQMLGSIDPLVAVGRDTTLLRDVLHDMARSLDRRGALKPLVEASVRHLLAETYLEINLPADAEAQASRAVELLRRADGSDPSQLVLAELSLALARDKQGRSEGIVDVFRRAVEIMKAAHGPRSEEVVQVQNGLALMLCERGEYEPADALWAEALAFCQDFPDANDDELLDILSNLGVLRTHQGQYAAAEAFFRQALARSTATYGLRHLFSAKTMDSLGGVLAYQERFAEAEELLRAALAVQRDLTDEPNSMLTSTLNNLAYVVQSTGRLDEAESLYREALALHRQLGETSSEEFALRLNNLGSLVEDRDDVPGALALYEEALEILEHVLPASHYLVANTRSRRGLCLAQLGQFERAHADCLPAYEALVAVRGPDDPLTRNAAERVVRLYELSDQPAEAAQWRAKLPSDRQDPP